MALTEYLGREMRVPVDFQFATKEIWDVGVKKVCI